LGVIIPIPKIAASVNPIWSKPQGAHGGGSGDSGQEKVMKINVTVKRPGRHRIYKVLKWIFVGLAIGYLLDYEGINILPQKIIPTAMDVVMYTVIAIFFKLQEDSNKPTVEE
jgi:hypothetical protein